MQRYTFYIITLLFSMLALAAPSSTRQLTGSSIKNGSAIITLPTTTGTICGISESCALTNKTISGLSNTISNIGLTTQVTGVLPIANGGTNNGSLAVTAGGTLYTDGSKLVNVGAGSSGQVLKSNGASAPTWGNAQGGLISDREMITNTDIEVDASGYTAYADAAGALPVDCTGGSPNSTIARSTTTPITGTGELLWTKSGSASRQGEGFSIPFTIGTADQAKVMQLDIDSIVRSGTFVAGSSGVDSDLEFYIYSVSDSQLIQPTTYKVFSNSSSGAFHTTTNFQTTASGTSYRLCVHTATTSTANFTVGFDNISIHPSRYTYGTPDTGWVSYTPTFTGFGTVTNINFRSRRNGPDLLIQGTFTTGTPTAVKPQITLGYAGINGSVTTSASANTVLGPAAQGASSSTFFGIYPLSDGSQSYFTFGSQESAKGGTAILSSAASFGSSTLVSVNISLPIQGWQSTVQMSDSAPQSIVQARIRRTSSNQSLTSGSSQKIAFNAVTSQSHGQGDITNNRISNPYPGVYKIGFKYSYGGSAPSTAGSVSIYLYKNGSAVDVVIVPIISGNNAGNYVEFTDESGKANDYYEIYMNPTTAVNIAQDGAIEGGSYMSVYMLSNPQTIGATETVSFTAYRSSNQTGVNTNNSAVKIAYDSVTDDSHGAFSTANNNYIIPAPGRYVFTACSAIASTNVLASLYRMVIRKNTTGAYDGPTYQSVASQAFSPCITTPPIKLVVGDVIDAALFGTGNNSSSTLTAIGSAADTYFSGHRIGL